MAPVPTFGPERQASCLTSFVILGSKTMKRLLGAIMIAAAFGSAQAAPIDSGIWYGFRWDGLPGTVATGISGSGLTTPGVAPWTITVGGSGATLTVTDLFLSGDRFSIFDGAAAVGVTSDVSPSSEIDCGGLIDACLANPRFSKGAFALAPGAYSFTFQILQNAAGINPSGVAAFRVDATSVVPVPPAAALLLSGLAGLGWASRRKRA